MIEIIKTYGLLAGLLFHGGIDLWKKKLPLYGIGVFAGVGLIISFVEKRAPLELLLALVPGVVLCVTAFATRQKIGYGDGAIVCAMGCYIPPMQMMEICMMAFFLAGITGVLVLLVGKRRKEDAIAFVPFLFVALVLERWVFGT